MFKQITTSPNPDMNILTRKTIQCVESAVNECKIRIENEKLKEDMSELKKKSVGGRTLGNEKEVHITGEGT